ncbi:MAG TPA: ribbon-helix-helix protein, CopG family [Solirubrobacterales bacterium]|nr:ribbon-helix-helix protein, CopG family [Solirubrobacterales bacterium]
MAKIEITLPDDLLRRVDCVARLDGETRGDFLRRAAERELAERRAIRHKEFEEMMPSPIHGGGESGRWIREDRDHRDDKRWGPDRNDP